MNLKAALWYVAVEIDPGVSSLLIPNSEVYMGLRSIRSHLHGDLVNHRRLCYAPGKAHQGLIKEGYTAMTVEYETVRKTTELANGTSVTVEMDIPTGLNRGSMYYAKALITVANDKERRANSLVCGGPEAQELKRILASFGL